MRGGPGAALGFGRVADTQEVTARNGRVIAIATEGDKHIHQLVEHVLEVPAPSLAKSVTVE